MYSFNIHTTKHAYYIKEYNKFILLLLVKILFNGYDIGAEVFIRKSGNSKKFLKKII